MLSRLFAAASLLVAMISISAQQTAVPATPPRPGMALSSTSIEDGAIIPNKYTQNVPTPTSPELEWKNIPAGVVSYALIMHDPDNAGRKMTADTLHWMAFNIPGHRNQPAGRRFRRGNAARRHGPDEERTRHRWLPWTGCGRARDRTITTPLSSTRWTPS